MADEKSCGAVVYTLRDGRPVFVIVENFRGTHGFPKGHVEGSESEHETAVREIREEVGLAVTFIGDFRISETHPIPSRPWVNKEVVYFLAQSDGSEPSPQPEELASAKYLPYDEAMAVLEAERLREILAQANAYLQGI